MCSWDRVCARIRSCVGVCVCSLDSLCALNLSCECECVFMCVFVYVCVCACVPWGPPGKQAVCVWPLFYREQYPGDCNRHPLVEVDSPGTVSCTIIDETQTRRLREEPTLSLPTWTGTQTRLWDLIL